MIDKTELALWKPNDLEILRDALIAVACTSNANFQARTLLHRLFPTHFAYPEDLNPHYTKLYLDLDAEIGRRRNTVEQAS